MALHARIGSATSSTFSSPLGLADHAQASSVTWQQVAWKEVGQRERSYPSLNLVSAFKPRLQLSSKLSSLSLSRATQQERQRSVLYHIKPGLAVLTWLLSLTLALPCSCELPWPSGLLADPGDRPRTCSAFLAWVTWVCTGWVGVLPRCHPPPPASLPTRAAPALV